MTATQPSQRPDPSRSGAVWVTGMGAFLLLAAAAVFTAVRWDQIPDAAKLATLVAATGGFLIAGRTLTPTLPATAGALFHLGAFLVPIDVAAIGVRAELDWSSMLLAQGVVATATFWWAAASERSVVLRWATGAAVVALAGGVGATTAVPAPLVLAGFALVALAAGRELPSLCWALLAGTAPLLTTLDLALAPGAGTLEVLGLTGSQPRASAVLTGGLVAAVLAVLAQRRGDVRLALLGVGAAATGVWASWTAVERSASVDAVGLATAFALAQAGALATTADPFWHRPSRIAARAAAILAFPGMVLLALTVPFADALDPSATLAVAAAVVALGWLASDARDARVAHPADGLVGRAGPLMGASIAGAACTAWATGSGIAVAGALLAVASLGALAPQRRGAAAVAAVAGLMAPLLAVASVLATGLAGAAAAVLLTEAAVRRSRHAARLDAPGAARGEATAWLLAIAAIVPAGWATAFVAVETRAVSVCLAGAAVLATLVAAQADRGQRALAGRQEGPSAWTAPFDTVARMAGVSVLAGVVGLPPSEAGVVALVVAALSVLDAMRLDRPTAALGAAVAIPVAVASFCLETELSLPRTGVALTVAGAVLAGLGAQLGGRWLTPVVAAVGLCVGAGIALAAEDVAALADALVVTGGIGVAASVAAARLDGAFLSGAVITLGTWLRLADGGVGASEPYLVPVTALLLLAGMRSRSAGASSWVAYGPAVGLLGGSALLERLAGGAGWHALVAGAVGVVAVAAGGARRLAAPLLLGSALLVALVGYETLAVTSGLPTWMWLALGGAALLAAGVVMERHDVGPLETGRRLVDVVTDRFA